jgi:hypothetical protein
VDEADLQLAVERGAAPQDAAGRLDRGFPVSVTAAAASFRY